MSRTNELLERLFEPDDDRSRPVRARRRLSRVLYLAGRGFLRDECFHHAGALAFDTLLAVVPLCALIAGVLRAVGAWDAFVATYVEPWLKTTLGPAAEGQITMRDAFLTVIELGERANLQALGFVGVVALLYLLVVLLVTVEKTFNRIFGAGRSRSVVRRAADYAAILFVLPLGLVLASALGFSSTEWEWLGPAAGVVSEVLAMLAACGALTFLYLVMPHTSVRFRSALLGGVVAGVLWHFGLELYSSLQVGVARYNALYSSFAALPLFLVWVFVSWLLVLLGAEVAAAHQDVAGFRWRVRDNDPSARTRHELGVRLVALIARAFVRGEAPPTLVSMAQTIGAPRRFAEAVLEDLTRAELLARAQVDDGRPTYALLRDPSAVRVSEVLRMLDEAKDPYEVLRTNEDGPVVGLDGLLERLEEARRSSEANVTLRELALTVGRERATVDAA